MKICKIIYMGTPEFAIQPLRYLVENSYQPLLCITQPARPSGRKKKMTEPVLKEVAESFKIEVLQPENPNEPEILEYLERLQPDLIVTAAYGSYLGRKLRALPRIGAINIHPSLLPQYRGATPVNSALWNGDNKTGVSIFRMTSRMDAGNLLSQTEYQISEEDNYSILLEKLSQQGAADLIRLLEKWEKGELEEQKQEESEASYCHKLEKQDLRIDWSRSAEEIYHQVRALADKPGAFTEFRETTLKILKCRVIAEQPGKHTGEIIAKVKKEGFLVTTGKGTLLVEKVQPAGKSIMNASEYDLGARIREGERFL